MVYIKSCWQKEGRKKFYELAHGYRTLTQEVRHHFLTYLGPPFYEQNERLAALSRELSRKKAKNLKDWEIRHEILKVSQILKIIIDELEDPPWWRPFKTWMQRRLRELSAAAARVPSLIL